MTNKVFQYNGRYIADMGDEELMSLLVALDRRNFSQIYSSTLNALRSQILLRMSARKNVHDGIYFCQECGFGYCYEQDKSLGATQPADGVGLYCSQDCREEWNEKADPDETELNKSAWAQSERMPAHERRA